MGLSLLTLLLGVWSALPTFAEEVHHFDVETSESVAAIREFGRQSGTQILVSGEGLAGKRLNAVEGELSTEEGLRRLLEGSGLIHRYVGDRAIALVPVDEAPPALRLSQAEAASVSTGQKASELEEVIVTGKVVFDQYDAFGATKMGLPLKDTPQTVNVVTSDLIDIANMNTFEDFYKVDASTGTTHALDGYPRHFYRGFYQQGINAVRVDGFRMPGNINLDLALFDRFEVIKGPTSTLYGQNNVGGSLNAVSKQPQGKFSAELGLEATDYDQYRADLDVTGPMGDAWSYRVVGAYGDAESFIDFVSQELNLISFAVQYAPSEATRVTLRASGQKVDGVYHYAPALQLRGNGTGFIEERVREEGLQYIDVPRSRFYGMPWNDDDRQVNLVQLQGEHTFSGGWTLRAHAQHSVLEQDTVGFYVGGPFNEDGLANFLWNTMVSRENTLTGGEINLFGDITLFGREHTLFFGIDSSKVRSDDRGASTFSFGYETSFFNAFAPDYGAVPKPESFDDYPRISDSREESLLSGATLQLILKPLDRLSILLAGRLSKDKLEDGFRGGASIAELEGLDFDHNERRFEEFTVQTGATYEITEKVNVYASYGESFNSQFGRTYVEGVPEGELIDPETGTINEIGLKSSLNEHLLFTAAAFDMKRSDIAQDDLAHPCCYYITLGTQRSRGVEVALQGRVSPPLSVSVSMAFLDAEYVDGELKGLQSANAPKFGLSAYGTYEILGGTLQGLGFGLGVVHKQGLAAFDYGWTIYSPGGPVVFEFEDFTELDARVFYGRGRWNFSLAATNLLDEKYYSQTFDQLWWATNVNPPRTLRAKATYRF